MTSEDSLAGDAHYRALQMAAMEQAGVTVLRQVFDWKLIERTPGHYDFSYLYNFVNDAAAHGITVMPVLFGEPKFHSARPSGNGAHGAYPPKKNSSFARFAKAAVKVFGPNGVFWATHRTVPTLPIRVWQIWNEPNLKAYWRPAPQPKAYVSLLHAASTAIRKQDRGAEIVTAGIPQSHVGAYTLKDYVAAMLRNHAAHYFDTLAVNSYATTGSGVVSFLRGVRRFLNSHHASGAGLRATEFGWSDTYPSPDGSVYAQTPDGQAARIGESIRGMGAARKSLKLRGFVYFNWRDAVPYNGGRDLWGLHTGLQRLDGTPKPAFSAFAAAAHAI